MTDDGLIVYPIALGWLETLGLDHLAVDREFVVGFDYGDRALIELTPAIVAQAVDGKVDKVMIKHLPAWVAAVYEAACERGAVTVDPKKEPSVRRLWRRFILLLTHDAASQAAIESARTLGGVPAGVAAVSELLDLTVAKLGGAEIVQRVQSLQLTRARRIEMREIGFSQEPYRRPTDAEFDREAKIENAKKRRNR